MRRIDNEIVEKLIAQAHTAPRMRQHLNLHEDRSDPCQRLLNAVLRQSYIRPHRHLLDPKSEMLVALRGQFAALSFDDEGGITQITRLCADGRGDGAASAVELPPQEWHTVVAITEEAVLLEVKAGPFDPSAAKDLAAWAPAEDSDAAPGYLQSLRRAISAHGFG